MDVNIWSTFKKGGRVARPMVSSNVQTFLPSQIIKQKQQPLNVDSALETLHILSEINSLSKEDVQELLDIFESEILIPENREDILNRAKLLSKYGFLPEITEDETIGGVKYELRESPKKKIIFEPSIEPVKRRTTQRRSLPQKLQTIKVKYPRLPTIPREGIKIVPDRTPEEKERILSLIQKTIFERQSLSQITKLIFEDLPLHIFSIEQKHRFRYIYELTGVEKQCNSTIGKADALDEAGNRKFPNCYLCGKSFYEGAPDKIQDELRAACEHILPIIQAAFFLQIYHPGIDMTNSTVKKEFELEYNWAHRCCNYEKSDISLMRLRMPFGKSLSFGFNSRTAVELLSKIADPTNPRIGLSLIQNQITSKDAWEDERIDVIESIITKITEYLNSRGNIALLFLLCYDKITNSERVSQRFIDAIGEAKQRIKTTKIRLILNKETNQSVSGEVSVPVESAYQKDVKRTLYK